MTRVNNKFLTIRQVLKQFGGAVNYFDTNDSLPQLASLINDLPCDRALVCCGAGDQALTMLGAGAGIKCLWAVDINPAQLFLLAAKAQFLKEKKRTPTFDQLQKIYGPKITAGKAEIRGPHQMRVIERSTGKQIMLPADFYEKYLFMLRPGMYVADQTGPYWQTDVEFIRRVGSNISRLRLGCIDLFNSPDHFKPKSLDLIYLSDILWTDNSVYYQSLFMKVVNLLRVGGVIVAHWNSRNVYFKKGFFPTQLFAKSSTRTGLEAVNDGSSTEYTILRRTGRVSLK